MRLPQDILTGTMKKPSLFLCETDKSRICELETIELSGSFKFNAYSELTFSVPRTYINMTTGETQVNPHYNKIEALRLVYLEGFGYFEIQDPELVSDGIREVKNVTAYSLEYTLSQKYLEEIKINTGDTDSHEVIVANGGKVYPILLYNQQEPELSLLDLILEKIYGWKIGHVDNSLKEMGRTFEISRASVYDFIVQDICDKFNCFAVFDTIDNTINLYAEALITKHIGDGSKTAFIVSPAYSELGTVSIDGYKTTSYKYEIKKINNVLTGTLIFDEAPKDGAKIEITDGSQKKWATDVYVSFDNLAQEVNVSYSADDIKTVLTVKGADDLDIREVNMGLPYIVDLSYYHTVEWMGEDLYKAYTDYLKEYASEQSEYQENEQQKSELNDLIWYEKNRVSLLYSKAENVTNNTIGTYYVKDGISSDYFMEVKLPDDWSANTTYYILSGDGLNENKFRNLYYALHTYLKSQNDKDVSEIQDLKESFSFIDAYSIDDFIANLSNVDTLEEKNQVISNFLNELLNQLGLIILNKYLISYTNINQDIIKESGYDNQSNENYWIYYTTALIIDILKAEIQERQNCIDAYEEEYNILSSRNSEIANNALISKHFSKEQLIRLSSFLREDEYTDDNFVQTKIDSISTIMQTKKELLECGKIELAKLCEPKLAFSMDMANIYALPEFEPIIDQFQLGNLINVVIRSDYIKRARLLEVNINFDDFSDFTCEFGELTNLRTPSSIHADLLASALTAGKSVASNASYWDKGSDSATSLSLLIQQGLLDATTTIKAIDGTQGVSIDKHGIHLQEIDPNTGTIDPKEGWIVNNQFLYSDDNFNTTKSVFGEYTIDGQTKWGLLAEAVMAGYVAGCTIEGGTINIGDGTFVVAQDGSVTMKASSIDGYVANGNIISSINQSPEEITINANKISLAGKKINLTSDNITIDSTNFKVTSDGKVVATSADIAGKITATSGEIAGWTIYDSVLRKETVVDNVTYQMYMQASDGVSTTNAFAVRKKNPDVSSWDMQFAVTYAGKMTAKNANITGTITAKDGSIAGYNIGPGGSYDNALYKRVSGDGSGVDYEVGLKATSGDTDLAFYVKQSADEWASNSNVFYVRNNGQLYAQKADITGKITASSGKIGSWNIGDMGNYTDSIYSTFCAASTPSSDNPEYAVFMRGKGSSSSTIAIGVKKRTSSSTSWNDADNPFYVRKDGYVVMTNANVTGTVNATAGKIGGCSISNGVLNVSAANITSGTFDTARIPNLSAAKITSGTLDAVRIPNLSADKITAGTLDVGRIPNISASKITSGTISTARLDSSVITTDNFSSKTLSTSNLTVASGCRLGVASEYNARLYTSGSYTNVEAYGPDVNYGISWYALIKQAVKQSASSRDIKTEIHDFDERYDKFFDNLTPQLYKYDFATVNGYSMGYIWEDTKDAYLNAGLTSNDVGAVSETESVPGGKELDRTDFIALNTWQIQKLKARVEELENKLAALGT